MAKIASESRDLFNSKVEPYKQVIDKSLQKEKDMLNLISKDSTGVAYKKYVLAEEMMYVATLYLTINNISVELLDVKNTEALNDARKSLYKSIIYFEEIVGNLIDAPYSEYEEKVAQLKNTPIEKRYFTMRKLGLAIRLVMDAYGDNTKWKLSFVEVQGRFCTVFKNMLNLREAGKIFLDPSHPDYDVTIEYLEMVKALTRKVAEEYRDKYELSSHRIDDMRNGILFLASYRRLCIVTNETEEAEETKRKAGVWKDKLDKDRQKGIAK